MVSVINHLELFKIVNYIVVNLNLALDSVPVLSVIQVGIPGYLPVITLTGRENKTFTCYYRPETRESPWSIILHVQLEHRVIVCQQVEEKRCRLLAAKKV